MRKSTIFFAAALALAPLSSAWAVTDYTAWATSSRIIVDEVGTKIYVDTTIPNANSCDANKLLYVVVEESATNYQAITAAAMTGMAGGFELRIKITGCTASDDRPKSTWVSFRPAS